MSTYGLLYNWPAVMHGESSSDSYPSGVQGICPSGWHVPSNIEWEVVENAMLDQIDFQCGSIGHQAKALASTAGWYSSTETCAVGNNQSANNATGFSAFPAGYYYDDSSDYIEDYLW